MWDNFLWPQLSTEEDKHLTTLLGGVVPGSPPGSSSPGISVTSSPGLNTDMLQSVVPQWSPAERRHKQLEIIEAALAQAGVNSGPENTSCIQEHVSVGVACSNHIVSATKVTGAADEIVRLSPPLENPPPYAAEVGEEDGPDVPCIVEGLTIMPVYAPEDGSCAYLKVNGIIQGYLEGDEYYEVDKD